MLVVKDITIYHADKALFAPLSFRVTAGEILVVTGPSGCGKSTLLNWIIGALPAAFRANGTLWVNDERRDHLPTEQRRIAVLLQTPLLFAHLSVGQNMLLAIPARSGNLHQRRAMVQTALADAELTDFYRRDPATLSGGQQARVSVLRALLSQPQALLLDEPFAALDHNLRTRFRAFVFQHIRRANIPVVMVSHDPQDIPAEGQVIQLAEPLS